MKVIGLIIALLTLLGNISRSQDKNILIQIDSAKHKISRHIYGQFSEHLGRGIYQGIWVGNDSDIPNTNGIRTDVISALRKLDIPNLRWPGGCFADEYHWQEGVGNDRPTMVNTHWGGVVEDNSFGTHEFMELCRQLDTEPYICGNVGSGSVEEMSDWVEYLTFDGVSPMSDRRRQNGQEEPWAVRYWGVGNESWGCGGHMRPEYYADLYNRYATYCRDYGDNQLYRIAGGSSNDDYNWTEVLLKNIKHHLVDGISVHYYTINKSWNDKHSATEFDESSYFDVVDKSTHLDEYLKGHIAVLDKYDPENSIDLIVDEWGTWHQVEPNTRPGFLYQQNTLRDAFVAALSFNIFHKYSRRVHMANIAQTVNVLQAMILTQEEQMLLTPTYHVFDMYKVHQDGTMIPLEYQSKAYVYQDRTMDALSITCSKTERGTISISMVNVHPHEGIPLSFELYATNITQVDGTLLTANSLNAHNTFENQHEVEPVDFDDVSIDQNLLTLEVPAKSIITLTINPEE